MAKPMFLREQIIVEEGKANFFFFQWLSNLLEGGGDISNYISYGLAGARPANPGVGTDGAMWYSTDTNSLDFWTGSSWVTGVGGGGGTFPAAGMAVSAGAAWAASKATPSGAVVGTTDSQALTNKTLTIPIFSITTSTTSRQMSSDSGSYPTWHLPAGQTRFAMTASGGLNANSLSVDDNLALADYAANAIGYRGTPVSNETGSRSLNIFDMGKMLSVNSTGLTLTLTPNGTNPLPVGFSCEIYSAGNYTTAIARGAGVTAYKQGSNTSADGTIAIRGVSKVTKHQTNVWVMENVT